MLKDAQQLEFTTDSPEARAAIDRFIDQILSMGNNPEVIFNAVEAEPTSVIALTRTRRQNSPAIAQNRPTKRFCCPGHC